MKIAVTGATGFLGSHLIKALKAEGKDFVCLVRSSSPRLKRLESMSPNLKEVDFNDVSTLESALNGCDTVIHLLGLINGTEEELRSVNIETTRCLIDAACRQKIKKFIYISSVAAIRRHGYYGETKYEAEEIIRNSELPYLFFRPAYIYGIGDENNTSLMTRTLKRYPVVPLLGGGSFRLQPVYVGDVVPLIIQALDFSSWNKIYNVAGPAQVSLREMLEVLAGQLKVKRLFLPIPLKPVQALLRFYSLFVKNSKLPVKQILELDKHEAFDISETQKDFHFNPVTFDVGAQKMFASQYAIRMICVE